MDLIYIACLAIIVHRWSMFCESVQVNLYPQSELQGNRMALTLERCENIPSGFKHKILSASTDDCVLFYLDECCQGFAIQVMDTINFQDTHLAQSVVSISPCDDYKSEFPTTLDVELTDELVEVMTKVEEFHDTAMYFNEWTLNCSTTKTAYASFIDDVWSYTKYIYGNNFGPEGSTLFAFLHGGLGQRNLEVKSFSKGHFQKDSNCRNAIHLTHSRMSAWAGGMNKDRKDDIIHEISKLVAWTAKGVYGNPSGSDEALGIMAEPWADIFIYDVYRGLGMIEDAERVFERFWETSYPRRRLRTFWFKDWFFPLYAEYGGARVLNNYFNVLSRHFPRTNVMGWRYEREMNLGEFVHFFSGAVQTDLRPLAAEVFVWNEWNEKQFQQAKRDFPRIQYHLKENHVV